MTGCAAPENPIDRLQIVVEQLRVGGADEEADWLDAALARHIRTGESLDVLLGLAGRLGRSPRFGYLLRQRNFHLREALWHCDGDRHRLAEEIARFETRLWPRWRYQTEADPAWPATRREIFAAFRIMPSSVPSTADGLRKALCAKD